MAQNVRFVKIAKKRYLEKTSYDSAALYFCEDTNELYWGDRIISDGVRVVPTHADLPSCPTAADGVVYYVTETRNGYVMAPDRSGWLQTIYAPVTDAYQVPESEIYNTVTTVGAVRDIEKAIYEYIDKEIEDIEVSGAQGKDGEDGKTPYIQDSYWYIDGVNTGVKAEGVDGKDGANGKDGTNGIDGKTPYIQDGYWYIDGVNTEVKAEGVDGKDGYTPVKGVDYFDGQNGKDGVDGKDGVTPTIEISEDGYWVINDTKTEHKAIGIDGKDGVDGTNGADGKDGITPTVEINDNGYWIINGATTEHKAIGEDGKNGIDGKDGTNGVDGKDGAPGQDGKDGASAYEVWLNAGHSGSEDDFLQWLKGDTEPFGDVVTSINAGGIVAGTSLKGKTVKDVLTMLLGIKEAIKSVVDYIMTNSIPCYSGLDGAESSEVAYQELDTKTAEHTDQGFYTTTDANGEITNAGYQISFEPNSDGIAQTFSIYSDAKIVTAYQYHPALGQWVDNGFDGTYWIESGTDTKIVNGQEVIYTTYAYNVELMGDAIVSPEYWRFEVEVL